MFVEVTGNLTLYSGQDTLFVVHTLINSVGISVDFQSSLKYDNINRISAINGPLHHRATFAVSTNTNPTQEQQDGVITLMPYHGCTPVRTSLRTISHAMDCSVPASAAPISLDEGSPTGLRRYKVAKCTSATK